MFSKKSNQTLHHVIIKIKSNNLYCYHETQTTRWMMLPGKPNQTMHNVMIEQNKAIHKVIDEIKPNDA